MYDSPRRRPGDNWLAGAHARQVSADVHEGTYRDFLRRHERECIGIATAGRRARSEFAQCLTARASDPRNLMSAIDHLTREPDKALGPRGLELGRLTRQEQWELCRALRDVMRGGSYRPGRPRRIQIPKASGTGTRLLEIAGAEDRLVQRAIAQVLQPYLDPSFDRRSLGYRPGYGREHALALADILAARQGRHVWVTADIRDAFTQVPHRRLFDILRRHGLPQELVELIGRAIGEGRQRRGLPQGGCLSPLLLNVFLDWFLDRPWRQQHPDKPLIRVADDILVLCRSEQEALDAYDAVEGLLRPAGMPLKGSRRQAVADLTVGQTANWLGYHVGVKDGRINASISEKPWSSLNEKLVLAHLRPQSPLRAYQAVLGWVDQLGPCLPEEDVIQVHARAVSLASLQAFEEVPSLRDFWERWEHAHVRYRRLRRVMFLEEAGRFADGSAHRHRRPARQRRGVGAPLSGAPTPSFSATLYTDGACDLASSVGGWAFVLTDDVTGQRFIRTDSHPRATNNRMELMAVIRGLEALEFPADVLLITDSRYVLDGLTQHLPEWVERHWRRRGGGQVANASLWRRLAELVERHRVRCRWVRGHSGEPLNEYCDRLAAGSVERHRQPVISPSAWS